MSDVFDEVLAAIQPAVELVARDLASLVEERIADMIGKIHIALTHTFSLAASELDNRGGADVEADRTVHRAVAQNAASSAGVTSPARKRHVEQPVSNRLDAGETRQPARPSPVPGKVTCKKCGFVGGNARGCGKSHPTQGASVITDGAVQHSGRTPPPAPPRVSTIAARVYTRAKQAAAPSITEADDDTAPEDDVPLADKIAEAEGAKAEGELPEPSSSWEVDGEVVLRVGAGGTAAELGARRMCGICGVRGHNAQRCPRRDESESELDFEADA